MYSTCVTYNFICLMTNLVLITVKVQKVLAKMNGDWIPILLMCTMFVNCVYLRCDLSICLGCIRLYRQVQCITSLMSICGAVPYGKCRISLATTVHVCICCQSRVSNLTCTIGVLQPMHCHMPSLQVLAVFEIHVVHRVVENTYRYAVLRELLPPA